MSSSSGIAIQMAKGKDCMLFVVLQNNKFLTGALIQRTRLKYLLRGGSYEDVDKNVYVWIINGILNIGSAKLDQIWSIKMGQPDIAFISEFIE